MLGLTRTRGDRGDGVKWQLMSSSQAVSQERVPLGPAPGRGDQQNTKPEEKQLGTQVGRGYNYNRRVTYEVTMTVSTQSVLLSPVTGRPGRS